MLTKRIICNIGLNKKGGLIFNGHSQGGGLYTISSYYNEEKADEIYFYYPSKIDNIYIDRLKEVAAEVFVPLCVGGNFESKKDFPEIFNHGGDKISLNESAIKNPQLIKDIAIKYGDQAVSVLINIKEDYIVVNGSKFTDYSLTEWIKTAQEYGCGELVINQLDSQNGFNMPLLKEISKEIDVPLIIGGGKESSHYLQVFEIPQVDGVLLSNDFWQSGGQLQQLNNYLKENNINVRV